MNCCNSMTGECTQGPGCPARMTTATDTGHKVAHGKRTDYFGRAAQCPSELPTVMFEPAKTPLRIRVWDWLGNLPHRFGRWVDRSPMLKMAGFAIGAVTACALAALTLFHK